MFVMRILVVRGPPQELVVVFICREGTWFVHRLPAFSMVNAFVREAGYACGSCFEMFLLGHVRGRHGTFLRGVDSGVLVASACVLRVRELQVSKFNACLSPFYLSNIAVHPFCRVRGVLGVDERFARQSATLLSTSRVAIADEILAERANDGRQGQFNACVLTGLRVFVVARSRTLVVPPGVTNEFANFRQSGHVFPLVSVLRAISVDCAAAKRASGTEVCVN